ncbi:MAG: adenylate/guanylate cyclase domain-containing protein [bacterium]
MIQNGLSFFDDLFEITDTSPEKEEKFHEKALRREITFITYLLAFFGAVTFLIWPADFIYFQGSSFRAMLLWRLGVIALLTLTLGTVYLFNLSTNQKRFIYEVGVGLGLFWTFYILFSFAESTPKYLLTFFVAWSFVIPFFPIILISRNLKQRVVSTTVLVLMCYLGMFIGDPPALIGGTPKVHASIFALSAVWNFGTGAIAVTAGHFIHQLYKYSFFLSADLEEEKERSENLLVNILPEKVSQQLKQNQDVSEEFENVTVLFADIVEFTTLAQSLPAQDVVAILDDIFSGFDKLVNEYGLEKIKTIGDEYFVAAGVPDPMDNHAIQTAHLAFDLIEAAQSHQRADGKPFRLRLGMNTGPLVAGIIGKEKFAYDVWGDTVNVGSRMESQGQPGRIQVTPATKQAIQEQDPDGTFGFEERRIVEVKGKGKITTYFLNRSTKI